MIKFLKINQKKTDNGLNHKKKNNILFKCERIIRGSKIKIRLIISYGILVLIPLLIIGVTSVLQSKSAMNNKISNFSSQIMSQIGVNISSEMDKNSNLAKSIAIEPNFQNYFENRKNMDSLSAYYKANDLTKSIISKSATRNDMISLGIISTDNTRIGNFSSGVSENIIKKLSELTNNANGKFIWSLQTNSSGYSIYASAQFNDLTTSENFGIILEELNPKLFVNLFKNVSLGTSSDISIVDLNGTVIASEDTSLIGTNYKDKTVIEKIQGTEKNLTSIDDSIKSKKRSFSTSDGKELVSYAPLSGSDWYVVGIIPYSYLNSESNILRNNTLIIGLISFILAMIVALIISRSISNPLEKLVSLMKKAKEGNLTLQATDYSKDEIGEVISAFNDMVKKIKVLVGDIKIVTGDVWENTKIITEVSERSYASSQEIATTMSEI